MSTSYTVPHWEDPRLDTAIQMRQTRTTRGVIPWVPAKGGPQTQFMRESHFFDTKLKRLKNQTYYRLGRDNLWNDPGHTGPQAWKFWHGHNYLADSTVMDAVDNQTAAEDRWRWEREFVNKCKEEALVRLRSRKVERTTRQQSSAWVPNPKLMSETRSRVSEWEDLNSLPPSALRQLFTPLILKNDEEAVIKLLMRFQQEAKMQEAIEEYTAARRNEVLHSFQRRREFNDLLEELSGQAGRPPPRLDPLRPSCSRHTERLAAPKLKRIRSVGEEQKFGMHSDFKDFLHADFRRSLQRFYAQSPASFTKRFPGENSTAFAKLLGRRWGLPLAFPPTQELPAEAERPQTEHIDLAYKRGEQFQIRPKEAPERPEVVYPVSMEEASLPSPAGVAIAAKTTAERANVVNQATIHHLPIYTGHPSASSTEREGVPVAQIETEGVYDDSPAERGEALRTSLNFRREVGRPPSTGGAHSTAAGSRETLNPPMRVFDVGTGRTAVITDAQQRSKQTEEMRKVNADIEDFEDKIITKALDPLYGNFFQEQPRRVTVQRRIQALGEEDVEMTRERMAQLDVDYDFDLAARRAEAPPFADMPQPGVVHASKDLNAHIAARRGKGRQWMTKAEQAAEEEGRGANGWVLNFAERTKTEEKRRAMGEGLDFARRDMDQHDPLLISHQQVKGAVDLGGDVGVGESPDPVDEIERLTTKVEKKRRPQHRS